MTINKAAIRITQYLNAHLSVVLPLLTLLISLLLTYQVFNAAKIELEQKTQTYFDFRVREAVNLINDRMRAYIQVMYGASGLFKASVSVERNEFKDYIAALDLADNNPGIQGVGFTPIIPSAKKPQHVASIRSEGFPEYSIWPEGPRDIYTSVLYLEPFAGHNLRAFGYDQFTEPVRRAAMQKAIDTGQPQLSGKIELALGADNQDQPGFLIFLPIYRNGANSDTLLERREHILGWVHSGFQMDDFMSGLFGELGGDVDVHIFDGDSMSNEALLYDSDGVMHAHTADLESTVKLQIANHSWTINIRPLPSMSSRVNANQPDSIAIIGAIMSALLSLLIWFLVTGRERADNAARDMNKELIDERQRLSNIIEGTHAGTWEWSVQTGEILFNDQWATFIGYELSELEPITIETWRASVHPDDARLSGELLEQHFSGELAYYECEVRMRHKEGHWVWGVSRGKVATWAPDGKPLLMSGTIQNISQRKQAEGDLRIAATAFEAQEGIFVTDANNVILKVNQAFTKITGYSAEEAVGQTPTLLSSDRHDKVFYDVMKKNLNNTGVWAGEIWNRRKNGDVYPEYLMITAVKDAMDKVVNYVASLTDITMSRAAADEIKKLAFYDPLSQLPNRRLLLDRLDHALATSARSGQRGALLLLDLDNFKTINDTLGHDMGDLLLQQVATRLTASVRESDTVARLGGDEFVVLLENLSEESILAASQAQDVARKILFAFNQPYQLGIYTHHCTTSIGVTLFSGHEQRVDELLKQADIALYQSKAEGRDTLRFFDPKMQEAIIVRADVEQELRKAVEKNQFQLHYQIQVGSNGQALGAEALIRWLHPERGMISPFNFIPLAEDTGLIIPIGQWVLDTACAQLKVWQQSPLSKDLVIAVNVSAKQFHQQDFVEQVKATVQCHGVNPAQLKLELTESMLVDNINDIIIKMDLLSKIGVQFSLDDFGTGYSSLQYLKKLPLNQLKIDQSFVRDLVTDSSDRAIVRTIIIMAHSLNINVIAEGVETQEQRQYLLDNGCTHYQGYLFGKPVPIEDFEALLSKNK